MSQEQETNWTIRNLRSWTKDFLEKKGSEAPMLETEILLAHATGMNRIELFMNLDDNPTDEARAKFRDLVRRRAAGEPVAYLVGSKEFYSLDFYVDSNVLVPRPETEQLVLEAIEYVKKSDKTFGKSAKPRTNADEEGEETGEESTSEPEPRDEWSICDVGTGSGCVAVALAKQIANAKIVAIDLSSEALAVAEKNAKKNQVDKKIKFVISDLLSEVSADLSESRRFDMIVSNPPYVSEPEYEGLDVTVKNYEPRMALVGGPNGSELPIQLVDQAVDRLKSNGKIFLELSPTTVQLVADHMRSDGRWADVTVARDFAQLERFVIATRK